MECAFLLLLLLLLLLSLSLFLFLFLFLFFCVTLFLLMFRRSRHRSDIPIACHQYVFGIPSSFVPLLEAQEAAAAALNHLALAERSVGLFSSSLSHQRSAARLSPLNPSIMWNLIDFLRQSDRVEDKEEALRECLIARELTEINWRQLKELTNAATNTKSQQENEQNAAAQSPSSGTASVRTLSAVDADAPVFPWAASWNVCASEILRDFGQFSSAMQFASEAQRLDRAARRLFNQPEQLLDKDRNQLKQLVQQLQNKCKLKKTETEEKIQVNEAAEPKKTGKKRTFKAGKENEPNVTEQLTQKTETENRVKRPRHNHQQRAREQNTAEADRAIAISISSGIDLASDTD